MEENWVLEEGAGQGLAQRLHQEGLAGPLRWLENCLRRAARDREEDGVSQPVPLVPLTEENEDAMEDQRFQTLLRQLGLRPPASEQESFWRIPAALTPQQLRRAATSVAYHGPDPSGSPQDPLEPLKCPQDPSPGEGLGWGYGTPTSGGGPEPLSLCPSAEQLPAELGSDSESEEPVPVPVPSPVQSGTKRRRELDSEDE
ncbi:TIM protein, partial [Onychorhynchus coronatus]|nr:TIM protein [Onychorhynchus coronatus]